MPTGDTTTTRSTQLIAACVAALALLVTIAVVAIVRSASEADATAATGPAPASAVAEDSHRLSDAGEGAVTLVEFLDFECEGCRAVYPFLEELRETYAGQVTFVVRYFPMPGHHNSMTAAVAVEAAAQQGALEPMYQRMFETQEQWGEKTTSEAATFRGFAEDLGLDLDAYDAAVADPATQERVEEDVAAGRALGVTGTPTIFVDDERLDLRTGDDLVSAIDAALARR